MVDSTSGANAHENLQVRHDSAARRFTVTADGIDGVVDYQNDGAVMVITHTVVPPEIGGRGIAGQLVKAAFEHARAQDWKVRPECSYAATWVKRHPDYLSIVE